MVQEGDYIKLEDGREGMITWIREHENGGYLICFRDNSNCYSFFEGDYDFKVIDS
jgi:hypothetical protein